MDGGKALPEAFLAYYLFMIVRVWDTLAKLVTKDAWHGARWVWKHGFTTQFIFSAGIISYFVYTRGDYEDIEPLVDAWQFVKPIIVDYVWLYCFLLVVVVEGYRLRKILDKFLRKYLPEMLIERLIIRVWMIWKVPWAFWQMLVDRQHIFYSLEDGEHVARAVKAEKEKKKGYFGIPKHLRPPTIDERPQITPQQHPGVIGPNLRACSSGSGSGSGRSFPKGTGAKRKNRKK